MSVTNAFDDSLSVLGVLTGLLLVLVGLATVVGMPWQYRGGAAVTVLTILGALGTALVGVGLAWLAARGE